jgi:hypothetical protein
MSKEDRWWATFNVSLGGLRAGTNEHWLTKVDGESREYKFRAGETEAIYGIAKSDADRAHGSLVGSED